MTEHFISKFKDIFLDGSSLEIHGSTRFKELTEWDSLTALSLIAMMDSEYSVKLTGEVLKSLNTVEEIYALIHE